MNKQPIIYAVVGPTSSGKTAFAIELAKKINGEVVSADSRQVYKGLDIGTGKVTKEEMEGIPHHMLDVISLDDDYSADTYVDQALPIVKDIIARGKTPIICGGTGQYVYGLLYETTFPKVKPNEQLRKELETKTKEELFALLVKKDPSRAQTIDKYNPRRLIRALEILDTLGAVPKTRDPSPRFTHHVYILDINNDLLKNRIKERIHLRMSQGMLQEVETVLEHSSSEKRISSYGLEYTYLAKYLRKELSLEASLEMLLLKSYQYAKRQKTWNKKYFKDAEIVSVK